jgi:hypothetical protein
MGVFKLLSFLVTTIVSSQEIADLLKEAKYVENHSYDDKPTHQIRGKD